MESHDTETQGNINICPVCDRDFATVAGLRQHWTKGHSAEEIQEAINKNTSILSQQAAAESNENTERLPSPTTSFARNKLQIMTDASNQQFDIIENEAGGDCLFRSLLEFLKNNESILNNIPSNANELRNMAVNHILSQGITRFKDSIIVNLENQIPGLLRINETDNSTDIYGSVYSNYMSTPGNYGTVVELCAISELFGFDFYLIRRNSTTEFACYDYGSSENGNIGKTKISAHLLFTGNVNDGHFRLLNPCETTQCSSIRPGQYQLLKDYTSSRITSIAHASTITQSSDRQDYMEGNSSPPGINDHTNSDSPETSFEDFVLLLARCKRNIKVLKRIPRGARVSAANSLARIIDECLSQPQSDKKWMDLLTFAYTALQVPDKTKNVSLATLVKRNISKPIIIFKKRPKNRAPISMSRRVEFKIAEGDVKGAVKILSSNETLAPENMATLNLLRLKHPRPKRALNIPEPPGKSVEHLIVSEKDAVRNINTFPNGSAAGVDGILPQHLKDLTAPQTGQAGLNLIKSITRLSNFMLAGKMPNKLCSVMYGASLCALNKEDGGIRPIAVGNTFRRLTAKLSCASVRSDMASKFAPLQIGFGTKGGCEAAAHATRTFVKKNRNRNAVVLKIDFRNAFNELDRDKFLEEMRTNCPGIYPFLWQCYATSTLLFYGEDTILSENGAQQGDPCGPLVFCSAIQAVVTALLSEFVVFYLDDGTIAGDCRNVIQDFKTLVHECGKFGLEINPTKCELYFCSDLNTDVVSQFNEISPGIIVVNELTLLGAPITDNAFATIFNKKLGTLKRLFEGLVDLDNCHIAYYLLKNCLSVPKLVFLLRTSPTWNHKDIVEEIDNCIKSTLESLTNTKLDHNRWIQASLPVRHGGLGVRRVQDLALPAFLSSVNGLSSMISIMLHLPSLNIEDISDFHDATNAWQHLNPDMIQPELPHLQKCWDAIQINRLFNGLEFDNEEEAARSLAITKPESGAWLHALPSRTIGTLLDNNTFRIAVGLRLGVDICASHVCVCGALVDKTGRHGLKCKKSAGRWSRHAELNNIIKRALATAGIPARLEPAGLFRDDGKRVDGASLIPWTRGKTLVWDATCTDTFAPSNLRFSSRIAGKAADDKAKRKETKYKLLIEQNYHFVPFAVETMGSWCTEAIKFFNALSKMVVLKTDEPRSQSFLKQRISLAIQKGNAAAVMGCFQQTENLEEVFYL